MKQIKMINQCLEDMSPEQITQVFKFTTNLYAEINPPKPKKIKRKFSTKGPFTVHGIQYKTLTALTKAYGMDYGKTRHRIATGTPVDVIFRGQRPREAARTTGYKPFEGAINSRPEWADKELDLSNPYKTLPIMINPPSYAILVGDFNNQRVNHASDYLDRGRGRRPTCS